MDGATPGGYGGFEVGDDRYELPKVIAAMQTGLLGLELKLAVVREQLALGTSFGARVVTPHNQDVAVDLDGRRCPATRPTGTARWPGTAGFAGGRGGAPMGGGMPMGAGGGRGAGGEDEEHRRPSYLVEPDPHRIFGSSESTAPPVIGG